MDLLLQVRRGDLARGTGHKRRLQTRPWSSARRLPKARDGAVRAGERARRPGRSVRQGPRVRPWTSIETEALRALAPVLGCRGCAEALGRSRKSVERQAARLGISLRRRSCGGIPGDACSSAVLKRVRELAVAELCPACGAARGSACHGPLRSLPPPGTQGRSTRRGSIGPMGSCALGSAFEAAAPAPHAR